MEKAENSRWALVIRDDGEASVVPLSYMPVIHQEGETSHDKNSTVIVLQSQGQVQTLAVLLLMLYRMYCNY